MQNKGATPATVKAVSNIALILGLTAQIEDKYKSKSYHAMVGRVKKESEKLMDMWPESLTKKQVSRIEKRILRLEPRLEKKDLSVYTSLALAVIDNQKSFLKGKKREQAEILETRLFTFHKYADKILNKNDNYKEAEKAFLVWEG